MDGGGSDGGAGLKSCGVQMKEEIEIIHLKAVMQENATSQLPLDAPIHTIRQYYTQTP